MASRRRNARTRVTPKRFFGVRLELELADWLMTTAEKNELSDNQIIVNAIEHYKATVGRKQKKAA
jgi:hypothetical protein